MPRQLLSHATAFHHCPPTARKGPLSISTSAYVGVGQRDTLMGGGVPLGGRECISGKELPLCNLCVCDGTSLQTAPKPGLDSHPASPRSNGTEKEQTGETRTAPDPTSLRLQLPNMVLASCCLLPSGWGGSLPYLLAGHLLPSPTAAPPPPFPYVTSAHSSHSPAQPSPAHTPLATTTSPGQAHVKCWV